MLQWPDTEAITSELNVIIKSDKQQDCKHHRKQQLSD